MNSIRCAPAAAAGICWLQIVECSFDVERRTWLYMRDRPDKLTANHRSVFDKVMTSISDNITVRWRAALWLNCHRIEAAGPLCSQS